MSDTKHLLNESYAVTKRMTGENPILPNGIRQILRDKNSFGVYAKSLAEGLTGTDRDSFIELSENTRHVMMENSMFNINPYETLALPILRVFYPKLISRELVNVMPINKPDVVQGFIKAYFGRYQDDANTYPHAFPSVDTDISRGAGATVSAPGTTAVPSAPANIFTAIASGLNAQNAHIEKDFRIITVADSTGTTASVDIPTDVDGAFSETVTVNGVTDVISGHVDFENGLLYISSMNGVVTSASYEAYISLEENQVNPTLRYEIEKIRFTVVDRRISAEWSLNLEQDAKALFDIQLQSDIVNMIGEQIALDIDKEIITKLIAANSAMNPASHTKTFDKNPPSTYTWGRKMWYENVIPTLNELSAQIYNTCLMGAANTLACNPLDAAIFESFNTFEYVGNSVDGGDVGYRSATVQGGKWKILVSSIVPSGTVICKYRSNDLSRAAMVYAPYVPALLSPYPLGAVPSMTVMTRYATKIVRNSAIGVLNITDSAS